MTSSGDRATDLQRIAQELSRIADEMKRTPPVSERPLLWARAASAGPSSLGALAKRLYRSRRDRERYLPAKLFFDPAWDMLLDLFIAACEDKQLATTSLCVASGVPGTTAMRYIDALIEEGLAERRDDARDARRTLVVLSAKGREAMAGYLGNLDLIPPALSPEALLIDFREGLAPADTQPATPS